MLSWQSSYELVQNLTSDSNSDNLTMLKTLIREGQRILDRKLGIHSTEKITTFAAYTDAISGSSYQGYRLPADFISLVDFYVTVGTTQYRAELIQNPEMWRWLNATTTQSTSNFLSHCFIRGTRIDLYPIPSSANTATLIYRASSKPLVNDDYTTGTITTLTNAAKAVTAASSTFTSAMVGRYLRIDSDGEWYKIAAFGTTTTLTLESPYQGVSISAGTEAYTIGEFPLTPPDTHILPVYFAVWHWAIFRRDTQDLAKEMKKLWDEGVADAIRNHANRDASNIVRSYPNFRHRMPVNPNYFPTGLS